MLEAIKIGTIRKEKLLLPIMAQDKFSAVWVSHSSISDYLHCPRAYFLNHVYRDKETGHKIQLMAPALALGQAVHEVLESLSMLPTAERFSQRLSERFEKAWNKVSGEKGGFFDLDSENYYKERGKAMLRQVEQNPGPLLNLAVKIPHDLPHYWLSSEDNIILCGKIDWLEYLPKKEAVHIIDFKTGRQQDAQDSLQLPIYYLLVSNLQKRSVDGASYWYLESDLGLQAQELPDLKAAETKILEVAKKIKTARKLDHFPCPEGKTGCRYCRPLEKIVHGQAKRVGLSEYQHDVYVLTQTDSHCLDQDEAVIL